MPAFTTAVDIGNRAIQHCGGEMIDPALGFSEPSKNARQISFVYPKLRQSELERNTWRFAIRTTVVRPIDTTTMLLTPALWVASTTYFLGSIVADDTGTLWQSQIPNNLGNQPQNSNTWQEYSGPMTVSAWDTTGGTSYYIGELVYTAAGNGTNRVFLSQQSVNTDNPATATAWSATATYFKNQTVTRSAVAYQSLIDLNTNQDPTLAPALFNIATTYAAAAKVGASDGVIYQSIGAGNVGNDPTLDGGAHWTNTGVLNPWTSVFVGGSGSLKWLQIGGAEFPMGVGLTVVGLSYPLGSGPSTQSTTRNAYRLPAGFLRKAPQDPKAGAVSFLGMPGNALADDWEFQDKYLVSACSGAIVLRFVADTVDVATFHAMFCEGLGARIGLEVCEVITQSSAKKSTIASEYARFMSEARTVNAVLIGSEEPELDDYIACRA